jgi:CubicO group peptidase (beta-lactamase class C family)
MGGHKCLTQITRGLWLILLVAACRAAPPAATTLAPLPSTSPPPVSRPAPTPLEESSSYWPAERWRTSTPEEQGIDSARLVAMLDQIQEEGYPIHGIAIVRNGYLVMEAYVHPFRAEDRHYIASCTKSFVSALVGIALDEGFIDNLDQKLLTFSRIEP